MKLNHLALQFGQRDPKQFFKLTTERVNAYFKTTKISRTGNWMLHLKSAVMFSLYLIPFSLLLVLSMPTWGIVFCYLVMGLGVSGIGLCVMHDANHGSFSKHNWINQWLSHSATLIGASASNWKIQHNLMHHTYTNVFELDEDVDDRPFLRLSPHGALKKHHRFQHLYAPLLYCLATFTWITTKDFKQMIRYKKEGLIKLNDIHLRREITWLALSKLTYFLIFLFLPILMGLPWLAVLLGFISMHLLAGIIITTIFQLAHLVEGPAQYGIPKQSKISNKWATHQLRSTANFACENRLLSWFVGGLNFQIEHHLFPSISHIHYRAIAKIVKKTANECGLDYFEFKRLSSAIHSHYDTLKLLGQGKLTSELA